MVLSKIFFAVLLASAVLASSKLESVQALDAYIAEHFVAYPERVLQEKDISFLYKEYLTLFEKKESQFGFAYFYENLQAIIQHNREGHSWIMGLNKFADMSYQDFLGEFTLGAPQDCSATTPNYSFRGASIPEAFDWKDKGVISPVKNQGQCGSCWAFSTTACLEAHAKVVHGGEGFLDLSKQQLLDCAGDFDNHGCHGGLPSHAFEYLKYSGGIQCEKSYPYRARQGKCVFDPKNVVLKVPGGSVNITAGNEAELDEVIATIGPVSVAFQVVGDFRFYRSGVYSSKNCKNGQMDVNHAVLATGYGIENGKKFYNIKNSWGAGWGVEGYFKIERHVNMCGVAVCNSFPKLKVDSPKVTTY